MGSTCQGIASQGRTRGRQRSSQGPRALTWGRWKILTTAAGLLVLRMQLISKPALPQTLSQDPGSSRRDLAGLRTKRRKDQRTSFRNFSCGCYYLWINWLEVTNIFKMYVHVHALIMIEKDQT